MMNLLNNFFSTLMRKIFVGVVVVLLGFLIIFAGMAYRSGRMMLEDLARLKAHNAITFGKSVIRHEMLEGEGNHLAHYLDEAISSAYVDNIYIIDEDGGIILSSQPRESEDKIPLEKFTEKVEWPGEQFAKMEKDGKDYQYVLAPIERDMECHGCHSDSDSTRRYIAVKVGMQDLYTTTSKHRATNIFLTLLIFIGIGGIILLTIMTFVVKPIGLLRTHMVGIAGELDEYGADEEISLPEVAVPEKRDEIVDLYKTYNVLIGKWNLANENLRELHAAGMSQASTLATTGEMAACIAHEIRNPLAGIIGAIQVFDSELSNESPFKEIIPEMLTQLDRINDAISDLLSYARPSEPELEEIELDDIVEKTAVLFSQQLKGTQIEFKQELLAGGARISADPKLFRQVIWNILTNGFQALDDSGTLTIKTYVSDQKGNIEIIDTGKGISPEIIDNIFKPFYTTKHKGTGLGLPISNQIIAQHGGNISVFSAPGEGTTIKISLPVLGGKE